MGFFSKGKTSDLFKATSESVAGSAPRPTSAKSAASHPGSAGSAAASSNSSQRTAQAASRLGSGANIEIANQMANPLYAQSQVVSNALI